MRNPTRLVVVVVAVFAYLGTSPAQATPPYVNPGPFVSPIPGGGLPAPRGADDPASRLRDRRGGDRAAGRDDR